MTHKPVLPREVLEYLDPKPGENFIDGTLGQGGHTLLILEKTKPDGKVLGIDADSEQIASSKTILKNVTDRVTLVHDSYRNIKQIVEQSGMVAHGILIDLGYSSWHIDEANKGFSFAKDQALDMRYDVRGELTAKKIVNEYLQQELEKIISEYGEEKFARQIAKKITEARKIKSIESTFQLKEIIQEAVERKYRQSNIHCATRTFQALRIAVNHELENLTDFLPDALDVLPIGGRLVVISFHSLEDRIVKQFFKQKADEGVIKLLTKKPVMASDEEIKENPRARSAKLRAIVKNEKIEI